MPGPDDPAVTPPAAPVAPAAPREPHSRAGAAVGLAITLVAAGIAVAFGMARGDDAGRIVREVVDLHDRRAESTPPSALPDADPASTPFARRALATRWVPIGSRLDRVEGRQTATVFWQRQGRRIAYTRVDGDPVSPPPDSRRTGRRGTLLSSFDADGRTAVTWTDDGHTAVISAVGVSRELLYRLAGGWPRPARGGASP
jgi:YD repeat-containing protein